MMVREASSMGFVGYIERTRDYYAAQGYEKPYRWAHFADVPFAPLPKPLAECRVALVTTARPSVAGALEDRMLGAAQEVWSGPCAEPPERLYTDHLAWDREATHTDDVESFLPIRRLRRFVTAGRIGALAGRFHGVPTDYSQRRSIETDAPEILDRCREDGVDVALLVPL